MKKFRLNTKNEERVNKNIQISQHFATENIYQYCKPNFHPKDCCWCLKALCIYMFSVAQLICNVQQVTLEPSQGYGHQPIVGGELMILHYFCILPSLHKLPCKLAVLMLAKQLFLLSRNTNLVLVRRVYLDKGYTERNLFFSQQKKNSSKR